jgi:hypothetical protein
MMEVPSKEALERWPPDGRYNDWLCVCTPACDDACDGHDCGCMACYEAYQDNLSQE